MSAVTPQVRETKDLELSLGPIFFNWEPDVWRDFYFRTADESPVTRVFIGEYVCPKKVPFVMQDLPDVIERLKAAGKQVILTTPALIASPKDMELVEALDGLEDVLLEVNDIAALSLLAGRPHVIGPGMNVYNPDTLAALVKRGATEITLPVELNKTAIAQIASKCLTQRTEIQAFGRWPLAVSARCYHARAHGRMKDACLYACGDDPDGLEVKTLDNQDFLCVNGIQTLSHSYGCLVGDLKEIASLGVTGLRLSPQDTDMVAVARLYRDVLDGKMDSPAARDEIEDLISPNIMSNGFFHACEGLKLVKDHYDQ